MYFASAALLITTSYAILIATKGDILQLIQSLENATNQSA